MSNREKGTTPLPDGNQVAWTSEDASEAEVLQIRDRTAAMTFRVRTLSERPDGTEIVTTYGIPGAWLGAWLAELQGRAGDEAEAVLSVEAV